MGLPIYTKISV